MNKGMSETGVAESLIQNEIGCGPFQVLIVILVFVFIKITSLTTLVFMSFGNYNPGWRCLDNITGQTNNSFLDLSLINVNATDQEYGNEVSCDAFEACQHVEFNPESSTILTEWKLVCGKAWVPAFIISLQWFGNLVGSTVSGQLADTIGRKKTLYGSVFITAVLTFVSIFSSSWVVFAAFRFLLGVLSAFFEALNYVYPSEFLTKKWRGPLSGVPGWSIAGILFGVMAMLLKNWKHLLIVVSIICMVSVIPAVWVPESLRWLEVKDKRKEFVQVAAKMARLNNIPLSKLDKSGCLSTQTQITRKVDAKRHSVFDLFHPGYKSYTLIIGVLWLMVSMIYYAISFGIKALNGNFYLNFILLYTISLCGSICPLLAPNLLGRRRTGCSFMFFASICLLGATIIEKYTHGTGRVVGTLVLVMAAQVGAETTWVTQQVHLTEIYPTVVRGIAMNSCNIMARIGGIISPFMIPNDPGMVYVWFLIMGCLGVVASGLISRLPETKGKPLKETFEDTPRKSINVPFISDETAAEDMNQNAVSS